MRSCSALVLCGIVGCATSSDQRDPVSSDLEGLYAVSDRSVADGSCQAAPTPTSIDWGFFDVAVERVGGTETLVLEPCSSKSTCGPSVGEEVYFASFDDFEAHGEAQLTEFSGSTCTFEWHANTLEQDGDLVVFTQEVSRVTGVDGIDLDDCFEQQDAWTGARPCVRVEVRTAAPAR